MSASRSDSTYVDVSVFRAVTVALTMAEIGAFVSLFDAYLAFGVLPKDPARLADLIGFPRDEFASVWLAVSRKCTATPAGWRVLIPGG